MPGWEIQQVIVARKKIYGRHQKIFRPTCPVPMQCPPGGLTKIILCSFNKQKVTLNGAGSGFTGKLSLNGDSYEYNKWPSELKQEINQLVNLDKCPKKIWEGGGGG